MAFVTPGAEPTRHRFNPAPHLMAALVGDHPDARADRALCDRGEGDSISTGDGREGSAPLAARRNNLERAPTWHVPTWKNQYVGQRKVYLNQVGRGAGSMYVDATYRAATRATSTIR